MNKALYSSNKEDWCTPQDLFDELDAEFHFTLDAAASDANHKCLNYYTKKQNGLIQPWLGTVFCNPPYGRNVIQWVRKAAGAAVRKGATVVMLIAARTDTRFFHEYIYNKPNVEIRFIKGRLKFTDENGNVGDPAPFPSMVVIFRPSERRIHNDTR